MAHNILVVHNNARTLRERCKVLRHESALDGAVIACPSIEAAASLLEFNDTSVLVTELSRGAAALLPRLARSWPSTRFVIVAGPDELADARPIVAETGAVVLVLPLSASTLVDAVRLQIAGYDASHAGGVVCFAVDEMLQLAAVSGRATLLRIWSHGKFGHLAIEKGSLVDAEREGRTGIEAAYELLAWEDATVVSLPLTSHPRRTINLPLAAVMCEAARRRDDCRARNQAMRVALQGIVSTPSVLAAMVMDLDNGRSLTAEVAKGALPSELPDIACAAERAVQRLVRAGRSPVLEAVDALAMTFPGFELVLVPISGPFALLTIATATADAPSVRLRQATLRAGRRLQPVFAAPDSRRSAAAFGDLFSG